MKLNVTINNCFVEQFFRWSIVISCFAEDDKNCKNKDIASYEGKSGVPVIFIIILHQKHKCL